MDTPPTTPRLVSRMAGSKPIEIVLTVIVYTVYAAVLAASIVPSCLLLIGTLPRTLSPVLATGAPAPTALLAAACLAAATLAAALYLYLFAGILVQGTAIRLLSLGIGPGRYPALSGTTVRWLIFSGIYTISMRTILPLVPVSFLTNLYFRLLGCRMGRNVKINTFVLNDAYLLTIGNDVIIGGQTDISCHLFEHNHLVLRPVTIGDGTLIGAHSYISPGVTIGRRCVIGLYSYIRMGRVIPDGSTITSLAGIDVRTARHIERGQLTRRDSPSVE